MFTVLMLALAAEPAANAASDYAAAAKAWRDPDDSELLAIEPGTPLKPTLAAALELNAPALQHLAAGAAKADCRFPPGAAAGVEVPSVVLFRLGKLLLLRARSRHAAGDQAAALDDLGTALRLAAHLGGAPGAVPRTVASKLEQTTVETFEKLSPLAKVHCRGFTAALRSHLERRRDAVSLVEDERLVARQLVAIPLVRFKASDAGTAPVVVATEARVNGWFDAFVPYATTHRSIDKKPIDAASEQLRKDKKAATDLIAPSGPATGNPAVALAELLRAGKVTRAQVESALPVLIVAAAASDFTAAIDDHYVAGEALKRGAALGCR